MRIDRELIERWLEALKSGEYSQTTRTLRDDSGFCCLGVLADITDPGGWGEPRSVDGTVPHAGGYDQFNGINGWEGWNIPAIQAVVANELPGLPYLIQLSDELKALLIDVNDELDYEIDFENSIAVIEAGLTPTTERKDSES